MISTAQSRSLLVSVLITRRAYSTRREQPEQTYRPTRPLVPLLTPQHARRHWSPRRPGFGRASSGRMSAPDLSVDGSGHDEAREAVAHHYQQRRRDSGAVSLDGIAPELRSVGGDASGGSRRGSLQPSPAGSPVLQQLGSVSSNASSRGGFSPMMGTTSQPLSVNKLHSNGSQLDGHARPGQYYVSSRALCRFSDVSR